MLFVVFILLILWITQIVFLNFFYEKYTINTMNNIKSEIKEEPLENLDSKLETLAYENNICIEQISNSEIKTYNSKIKGCQLGKNNPKIINFEVGMINGNTSSRLELTNPNLNTKSLLYGMKKDNYFVFIYTTLEDLNSTTVILKSQLIYITLIVMIIGCFMSYFISKRITSPIIKMTKSAKKMGEGNYDVRFEKDGITEIDELADTLNYTTHELSKSLELRRDLMANVSHDLKTPLTMIKAYAEMVKDYTYKDKNKRNDNLDTIIKETDRLNILVNDILDLSKLQASKEDITLTEFDLVKEIKELIKRYQYLADSENYKIKYEGLKKAVINADKNKINQVMYNLVNNALNYTGKDKTVIISLIEEKSRLLFSVKDSGKGIDEEELKYIWDKYYKSEKNHQRSKIGTGIGLSIVKEILNYHDYEYGVKSIKGKGSTFYFYIDTKK